MSELRKCTVWNGQYKGIRFEINKFSLSREEAWTYYLYINIELLPERIIGLWLPRADNSPRSRVYYNYLPVGLFNNIDFHGGVTWYSKVRGFDGDDRVIKVGCDYQHLWDEDQRYTLEDLTRDAKNTIDKFLELVPEYGEESRVPVKE